MKVIQAQDEQEPGIDVAPLIDILFTLIIFFLVTTTFEEKEKEEEVRLPKQGGSSLVNKDRPIYINVLQDGSYSVGGDVVNLNDLEFVSHSPGSRGSRGNGVRDSRSDPP